MSSADDILSPYFASKPPVEKATDSTMSGFITLSPSCCPLRMSNGRYISTLFMYTEFSSKLPPLTLYCDDISLWVDTPACCCIISSTALPDADGVPLASFMSSFWVPVVCRRFSVTTTSPSAAIEGSDTSTFSLPLGCLNTLLRAL